MISSPILSAGDYQKSSQTQKMTSKKSVDTNVQRAEEFFFQAHPFSDLTLLVQAKELYVDKSVLTVASKVFQNYFRDETVDSLEILDISAAEMMELLRFLYPQFLCTIDNQNVTILLILAYRFEIDFVASACRAFILLYLSQLEFVARGSELVKQDDGICTTVSSILEVLCVWFREFFYVHDATACEAILAKFAQCRVSSIAESNGFKNLEENIKWKILQARAKCLETRRPTVFG